MTILQERLLFGQIFLTATNVTYAEKHDSHIYLLVPLHFLVHSGRGTWAENVQIQRGKQNLRNISVEFNHHLTFPWNVSKAQKAKCVLLQLENIDIFINRILYFASSCCECFLFHKGELGRYLPNETIVMNNENSVLLPSSCFLPTIYIIGGF